MLDKYTHWVIKLRWLAILLTLLVVGALASGGRPKTTMH